VPKFNFNYEVLSAIAGMTFWSFYPVVCQEHSQCASDRIPAPPEAYLRRPVLVIWDRLSAHKSRMTQNWIAEHQDWIRTEYLPAYAPELNPVEYLWGYWKQHELPNVCPRDWWELDDRARRALKRMRRRPRILAACWQQSELPLK